MKLQLYVQQVNGALEETSQSVLSGMPRVLRDTQVLQQEALILRDKMVAVKQEIAKVGENCFNVDIKSIIITLRLPRSIDVSNFSVRRSKERYKILSRTSITHNNRYKESSILEYNVQT